MLDGAEAVPARAIGANGAARLPSDSGNDRIVAASMIVLRGLRYIVALQYHYQSLEHIIHGWLLALRTVAQVQIVTLE
jgi:hypothetical protein|tara:strand:- start:655 stop:888 length:234 start_codon:yes stop_codon:yes gene_type:complete